MTDLEKLIDIYGQYNVKATVFDFMGKKEKTDEFDAKTEQAKQNLLNYIEQNYERKT